MAGKVKPIPTNYHTLTPSIVVSDTARAIDFYKRAFGATEIFRSEPIEGGPMAGKIAHAAIKIGDSMMMISDEFPGGFCRAPQSLGGTAVNLWIYTEDVDKLFNRAVQAGATAKMPPTDMFWGDRFGSLTDPFGHSWSIATHKEDVAPDELERRAKIEMAKWAQKSSAA
jgi:PhnB protein